MTLKSGILLLGLAWIRFAVPGVAQSAAAAHSSLNGQQHPAVLVHAAQRAGDVNECGAIGMPGTDVGYTWRKVRHVNQGTSWHPARDNLVGTDVYGDPSNDNEPWSIAYHQVTFDLFMFASQDCQTWLLTERSEVLDEIGSNFLRDILMSSGSVDPYTARWYIRPGNCEDPWISIFDHGAGGGNQMVYGECGNGGHSAVLSTGGGMNVYIRVSADPACAVGYSSSGGSACADDDECTSGPCHANAHCTNTEGSFTCTCNEGYEGGGMTCLACAVGYSSSGGSACADDDECTSGPCHANAHCTNTEGSFTCTCNEGYEGGGMTCLDVNECSVSADRNIARACKDPTTGEYTAACSTAQSSLGGGGVPERAFDGKGKDGSWGSGGCTHTQATSLEWWRADLHDHLPSNELPAILSLISEVRIWNRQDCCSTRLNGFKIWVSNSDDVAELSDDANLCYTHSGSVATSDQSPLVAACGREGRYVWISIDSGTYLTVCEVEIIEKQRHNTCDDVAACINTEGSFTCSGSSDCGEDSPCFFKSPPWCTLELDANSQMRHRCACPQGWSGSGWGQSGCQPVPGLVADLARECEQTDGSVGMCEVSSSTTAPGGGVDPTRGLTGCATTDYEEWNDAVAWWRIDLGEERAVAAVAWSRFQTLGLKRAEALDNVYFYHHDAPYMAKVMVGTSAGYASAEVCFEGRTDSVAHTPCFTTARYVWILLSRSFAGPCDVRVWGYPSRTATAIQAEAALFEFDFEPGALAQDSSPNRHHLSTLFGAPSTRTAEECSSAGGPSSACVFLSQAAFAIPQFSLGQQELASNMVSVSLWYRRDGNQQPGATLLEITGEAVQGFQGHLRVQLAWEGAQDTSAFTCGRSVSVSRAEFAGNAWVHLVWQLGLGSWAIYSNRVLVHGEQQDGGGTRGFMAEYYYGMNFETLVHTRTDHAVNVKFGGGGPGTGAGPSISVSDEAANGMAPVPGFSRNDQFSMRWTGWFDVSQDGTFQFRGGSDDGFRLRVDGSELLAAWVNRGFTMNSVSTFLAYGRHQIEFEAYENGGGAEFRLEWMPPWESGWVLFTGAAVYNFEGRPPTAEASVQDMPRGLFTASALGSRADGTQGFSGWVDEVRVDDGTDATESFAKCTVDDGCFDENFCRRHFSENTLSWSEVACDCPPDLPAGDGVGQSGCSAPSCSDGVQNQGEEQVDCGGPCARCKMECQDGWTAHADSCYRDVGVGGRRGGPQVSRAEAQQRCLAESGAHLPRVTSKEEAAFLWNTFGRVWLGLSREDGPFQGRTDAWKWEDGAVVGAGTVQVITGEEVAVSNSGMEIDSVSDAGVGWEELQISSWTSSGGTYLVSQNNVAWGGLHSGDGQYFVALRSWYGTGARIKQVVIGLDVGAQYVVRFKAAARPFFGETPILSVNVTDSAGNVLVDAWMVGEQEDWRRYPGAYAPLHARFEEFSVIFTAVEAGATIQFDTDMNKLVGDRAVFVDAVSIAKVASIKTTWSPTAGVDLEAESGAGCVALASATGFQAVQCEATAGVVCEMPRVAQGCREDEDEYDGRCFWHHSPHDDERVLDREGARAACRSWGGQLMTVRNGADFNWFKTSSSVSRLGWQSGNPWRVRIHLGLHKKDFYSPWVHEDEYLVNFWHFNYGSHATAGFGDTMFESNLCGSAGYNYIRGLTFITEDCSLAHEHWMCEKPAPHTLPPFQAPATPSCAELGGTEFDGHCYWYAIFNYLNSGDADKICVDWGPGGHLATPASGPGHAFPPFNFDAWIGLTSYTGDHMWRHVDGSDLAMTNALYRGREFPDASESGPDRGPKCVSLNWRSNNPAGSVMTARDCDIRHPHFLCKKPLASLAPSPPSDACDGLAEAQGLCWLVLRVPMQREAAAAACFEWGGELAVVSSAAHSGTVQSLQSSEGGGAIESWIGLHRSSGGSEWQWADGSSVSSAAWKEGQPASDGSGRCVVDAAGADGWEVRDCASVVESSICSKALAPACPHPDTWCETQLADMGLGEARVVHRECCGCCFFVEAGGSELQRLGTCGAGCSAVVIADKGFASVSAGLVAGMSQLRVLNLQGNGIELLPGSLLAGLTSLAVLRLSDNALATLPPSLFEGLRALRELDVKRNALANVSAGLFRDASALRFLDLQGNRLHTLPTGLFEGLHELVYLDLGANALTAVDPAMLAGLSELRVLLLGHNAITSVDGLSFSALRKLDHLDMSRNKLQVILRSAFAGLSSLETLLLQENEIAEIEQGACDHLGALRILELWGNELRRVPVGFAMALEKLELVSFWSNPLQCIPTLRASQGSDLTYQQTQSLPECLLLGCDAHIKDRMLLGGAATEKMGAELHVTAATQLLHMVRGDVAKQLDALNLEHGLYVGYDNGVRCWCVDTPKCFQMDDFLGERNFAGKYVPTVRWYQTYHDDFAPPGALQQESPDMDVEPAVVHGTSAPEPEPEAGIGSVGTAALGVGAVVAAGVVLALLGRAVKAGVTGRRGMDVSALPFCRVSSAGNVAGGKEEPEEARRRAGLSIVGDGGIVEGGGKQGWLIGKGSERQMDGTRGGADEENAPGWVAEWVATASQAGSADEMPPDAVRRLSNCSYTSQEGLLPADSLAPRQNPFATGARGRKARQDKSSAR